MTGPSYLNFGAIGTFIGHEMTHGFDDQGCQFDLNGNLVDWWNKETKERYLHKAECIIGQYGNYTEPTTGLKVCAMINFYIYILSHDIHFYFLVQVKRDKHSRRKYR